MGVWMIVQWVVWAVLALAIIRVAQLHDRVVVETRDHLNQAIPEFRTRLQELEIHLKRQDARLEAFMAQRRHEEV
ncbi:hypothetical protein D9599_25835 [Roseomonas sp. KE2513]|uniref:hypothetical protein n=1 Tax=Roseomonas sp. KE2513 TaxID=2479202 RepID=UPI0018DF52C1|nr:hypothetical protein [Roseomonas sp. KE2513]MBI0538977.1 hypothetical protein [Roseomonas sp. KE2513]